jgi:hypothetical protein
VSNVRFGLTRDLVEVPWDDVQRFQGRLTHFPDGHIVMLAIQTTGIRETVGFTHNQKVVASAALEQWLDETNKDILGAPLFELRNVLLDDLHDETV